MDYGANSLPLSLSDLLINGHTSIVYGTKYFVYKPIKCTPLSQNDITISNKMRKTFLSHFLNEIGFSLRERQCVTLIQIERSVSRSNDQEQHGPWFRTLRKGHAWTSFILKKTKIYYIFLCNTINPAIPMNLGDDIHVSWSCMHHSHDSAWSVNFDFWVEVAQTN